VNWDNLRILAAVGRRGSFSGAADEVEMSHSSVSRRMRALEKALDVRLFTPMANKLLLTVAGEELCETAARMQESVESGMRRVIGRDATLRGLIRFTTVDATARNLLPSLQRFLERYPEMELEVIVGQGFANLARSEADVVLRATNNPPPTYIGRRVATHAFSIYASKQLAARYSKDAPLNDYPWVCWGEGMTDRWMAQHLPSARVVCRANTALMVEEAVRAGLGIGHLASFGADQRDDLVRIRPPDRSLDLGIWLLTHRDLRTTARVRAFVDFLAGEIRAQRDLIEGRSHTT
jgi:DNA-binding transcriptional LysR family regulator